MIKAGSLIRAVVVSDGGFVSKVGAAVQDMTL